MSNFGETRPVAGAVLVGGSSTRMGTDKALIEIDGAPMAQRCTQALAAAGLSPVLIVGGESRSFEGWETVHVADLWPGEGPLGGIITAFQSIDADLLMVVPCDLVNPSAEAIARIIEMVGTHDVAVPIIDGRAQWLFSIWQRRALSVLEEEFRGGTRSIRSAVSALDLCRVVVGRVPYELDPYVDADTPDQLKARRPSSGG